MVSPLRDGDIEFESDFTDASPDSTQSKGPMRSNTITKIKEVGVPQEMYDALKQKLIEKETELEKHEQTIYDLQQKLEQAE